MTDNLPRSRSVYIGNLSWDVKDDDLKKLFSQVGTLISLRMPADPESGRSRGFAFCEYKEQESVGVAIKHFNGYELNGRKIRVDSAANNPDKDSAKTATVSETQYGEPCDPVKAPEIIASVVGKMSPQQVQQMISDTKRALLSDPEEARKMLTNNPQLCYALLLALVRGKYITKERATEALGKPEPALLPIFPGSRSHAPLPTSRAPHSVNLPLIPPVVGPGAGRSPHPGPGMLPLPIPSGAPGYGPAPASNPSSSRNTGSDYGRHHLRQDQRRHDSFDRPRTGFQPPPAPIPHQSPTGVVNRSPRPASPTPVASAEEKEKAGLIMQVLQLKEEDFAKMTPEQQTTVRMLRQQLMQVRK